MGTILKIKKESSLEESRKALEKLQKTRSKKTGKSLKDFYGKMPGIFGNGLIYQKKLRDEWQ